MTTDESPAATRAARLRALPGVDRVLRLPDLAHVTAAPAELAEAVRAALAEARAAVGAGAEPPDVSGIAARAVAIVTGRRQPSLRPVINATGVILHTNLGRSPLSDEAVAAISLVAAGYSNLEFELAAGTRGSRAAHVAQVISRVTGAETGLAVNNNAGAVLLALSALASGREVVVSRGQAVEIGGGFRIPDVLRQSGATLVEVGTTNRTYARDYEAALGPNTAALLHVHSSNFRVVGFTHEVGIAELVAIGNRHGVPVIDDVGSGALLDTALYGLVHEPTVQESVAAGTALVCFSGDKLVGGPQAGLICGPSRYVELVGRHPLARALRLDKLSVAALVATLAHYDRGETVAAVPIWRMIAAPLAALTARATSWRQTLADAGIAADVVDATSAIGGGSLPGETLPTRCLALPAVAGPPAAWHVDALAAALRTGSPAVVGRVEHGRLLLDPRTVLPGEADAIPALVVAAIARVSPRQ